MTVKELILKLKEFPEDEIIYNTEDFENYPLEVKEIEYQDWEHSKENKNKTPHLIIN